MHRFKILLCTFLFTILSIALSFSQQGLKAEYYDGTNFNRFETVKYVDNINLVWHDTPPVPNINPHECSIRWTGKLRPTKTGTYTFSAQVDDGIRVWVDHKLIIDQWDLNDLGVFKGTIDLIANHEYDLKVEYFNALFEGEVRLLWKKHKEELSWYEQVFGDGIKPTVIDSEYFLPPEMPAKIKEKPIEKPVQNSPKEQVIQTQTKKKVVFKKEKSPEAKEVIKPEVLKPKVSVKEVERYLPKNVEFEKGKTIILESSYQELNAFIQFMLDNPKLNVVVEGHTDVVGDPEMNLLLSNDRAQVIAAYLTDKGIHENRIKSKGFGGSRPLVIPKKGKYHPANRRVVFVVEGLE